MTADPELVALFREAMKPQLIRTVPEDEMNAGAQEWEAPGATTPLSGR